VALLRSSNDEERPASAAKTAAKTAAAVDAEVRAPDARPTPRQRRQITVEANVPEATCRFSYEDVIREQNTPCRILVPDGARLSLSVTRPGFAPFREIWNVSAERDIEARLVKRRLVKRPVRKTGRQKKPEKPAEKPAEKPEEPKKPDKPKKPKTIGDGTLDVEDL
jgi:hypothetical protein